MDVTPLLEIRPAPRAVFDRLPTHRHRARFHVRQQPQQPNGSAATMSWQPVTWGQFATQIRGVARWLIERECEPGDRIAIFAPNSVAWASCALGAQTAGAVFVPIYPASTPDQIAYILEHADIRFVFASADLYPRIEQARRAIQHSLDVVEIEDCAWLPGSTPATDSCVQAAAARDADAPTQVDARLGAIELDQTAQMLYTSGTSGNPKGVPLSHRNVGVNGADWLRCNAALVEEGQIDLLWLPMSHIFGFGELCAGNLLGWETYLASPADVLDLLPQVAPHVLFSVPAYWEKLARAMSAGSDHEDARRAAIKRATGGRLQFCLSGGAGLKVEIKQQLHAAGVLVIEGYGLTETSPTLTLNRPDAFRFDTVGKVLPSVELRLAEDGEIETRGAHVFAGYYKDAEATAGAFTTDGWFKTGDVGRWTPDGFLQIIDRKKDILVTAGGKNIPPANIEARFADDPVIERVVVYGDARPFLVAAVWTRDDANRDEVAARVEVVNRELARHETIKRFFVHEQPLTVEGGTLTTSLKLRRKAVYEQLRERFEALYS